jgi:phosphoribosylcarboxyaminoimidazole (NCAIR) mutase
VKGRVTSIGTTVTTDESDATKKVTVMIAPDHVKSLSGIDSADVTVVFAGTTHKNVLAVPVEALVSLNEGGYAVQLPTGALIAVETDLFADGMVEIRGEGLEDGENVVVAS